MWMCKEASCMYSFFPTIFVAPGVGPSYSWKDTLWVCMEMFPLLGHKLKFLLMGVFLIHLAVQVQAILCTPLSPGWAPAVNLVLWYHCWITTWKSDPPIVCTRWISHLGGLKPQPNRGPSKTPLLLIFIGTVMYGPKAWLLTVCQHHYSISKKNRARRKKRCFTRIILTFFLNNILPSFQKWCTQDT